MQLSFKFLLHVIITYTTAKYWRGKYLPSASILVIFQHILYAREQNNRAGIGRSKRGKYTYRESVLYSVEM